MDDEGKPICRDEGVNVGNSCPGFPIRHLTGFEVTPRAFIEKSHRSLKKRRVDFLTDSRLFPGDQRAQDPVGREKSSQMIGERNPHPFRFIPVG